MHESDLTHELALALEACHVPRHGVPALPTIILHGCGPHVLGRRGCWTAATCPQTPRHYLACKARRTAHRRPLSLLAHPPQSSRRAIVLDLFSRVRPSACGQLESAIAMQLLQPKEQAALAVGFSRHEFAAVVAATMRVCFGGEGCDWRA
eukprot:493854-Pleurochrysis_carterae.AAC.1